ncbi:MAG: anthranilate phosphoribosyltransferase [Phycisphaerales bacterium]|nr:anthranilate phosphoribosyltransferase [Planctomycetota bacterium]
MPAGPDSIDPILETLAKGNTLSVGECAFAIEELLSGRLSHEQVLSFLKNLAARQVSIDELVGAAGVMRRHASQVPVPSALQPQIIDTCGTGGAPKLFNVSTIAAIVAAGAGAKVVKHGNRSRTGRGSAEILAALGVNIEASPRVQAHCLEHAGLCFCFAIQHHPAARHAAAARRELGTPTIFNLLGPLTNPGRAERQLLGVAKAEQLELVAGALARLGCVRAMVVHSLEGFDELSTTGENIVAQVDPRGVRTERIDPRAFGLARVSASELQVESLEDAAGTVRTVLRGDAGPKTDIVLLNAAAALVVADLAREISDGLRLARESIYGGKAMAALEALKQVSWQSESSG